MGFFLSSCAEKQTVGKKLNNKSFCVYLSLPLFSISSFLCVCFGPMAVHIICVLLPLTIKHRLIPPGCCCCFFGSSLVRFGVLVFFTNYNNRLKVTNYWHWSVSRWQAVVFRKTPLGSMVLFFVSFCFIFGFAKLSYALSLSFLFFTRLLICFPDHTLISCQFMCSVYTLDIMDSNPTRIMCKFVSFRKWPVIWMCCQRRGKQWGILFASSWLKV